MAYTDTYTTDLTEKIATYTQRRDRAAYADTRAKFAGIVMGLEYALKLYTEGVAQAPKVIDLRYSAAHTGAVDARSHRKEG